MTISEKLKKIEAAVNSANIKAARMFDDAGLSSNSSEILAKHTLKGLADELRGDYPTPASVAQKTASVLDTEIGTHLPKSIKNVWSNFKRERGIHPADSDYDFHFCDMLPNGHDLTDDELGWPNSIPIAFDGNGNLVMVMPDLSYCETGLAVEDFHDFTEMTEYNYLVNPTRYIIYYDTGYYQYLSVSEDLITWKCLNISALKIMDGQICCDHNGIVYALCDEDLIRVIDPDKYSYESETRTISSYPIGGGGLTLMIIHDVSIADVITHEINQLRTIRPDVSIAVGDGGTIIRSTDNGLTWTKIEAAWITDSTLAITHSDNTWMIVGDTTTIACSTDDGLTWSTPADILMFWYCIHYANNVWIGSGFASLIYRSIDNGRSWAQSPVDGVNSNLYSIYYGNNTWIAVGDSTTILRSTDNGLTWTKITVSGVSSGLNGISYANNTWIAVGYSGTILRSTDDGLTWTKITISGVTSTLHSISYGNHTWIIVGASGTILRSTDDGLTWTQISVSGVSSTLYNISYANNTWIIVGASGTILRSIDNGLTWTQITVSGVSSRLHSISSATFPQLHRYGGAQFRKNYNFAEYFVSTNDGKVLIGGNVLGNSPTEEAGYVGKFEPGTVHKYWDGSEITGTDIDAKMYGNHNSGLSIFTDRDVTAIGGRIPYFIRDNAMDMGVPRFAYTESVLTYYYALGIRHINGNLISSHSVINDLFGDNLFIRHSRYLYGSGTSGGVGFPSLHGDPLLDKNTYKPIFYLPMDILDISGTGDPYPVPYVTRWETGGCKRQIITMDTIEVSPGRYLMLEIDRDPDSANTVGLYITDEIFPFKEPFQYWNGVIENNISNRSVRISNLPYTQFSDYLNKTNNEYQSGIHMVRGGNYIYIWMTNTDNNFLAWVYDIKAGEVNTNYRFIDDSYSNLTGTVLSISASNRPQTIKRGNSLPPITSNVFLTTLDNGVVKYYYLNYKAINERAVFTQFDPSNKYTATQTIVGNQNRRQLVRFNDKSIYYNHGNVFVRLDYLDPTISSEDYLGNIKHKYLMCGLNNTATRLRAIEDTDIRSGSFICTSTKSEVPFAKLNSLNKRTSAQNLKDQIEYFTPDIIALYNFSYGEYGVDHDDLSNSEYATYLSDTQFVAIFKKDEYVIDADYNPSSGNVLVKTGKAAGQKYSMIQGNGGSIDLIVYPHYMEINLSSEFLGTSLSYIAIGQRGAPVIE